MKTKEHVLGFFNVPGLLEYWVNPMKFTVGGYHRGWTDEESLSPQIREKKS